MDNQPQGQQAQTQQAGGRQADPLTEALTAFKATRTAYAEKVSGLEGKEAAVTAAQQELDTASGERDSAMADKNVTAELHRKAVDGVIAAMQAYKAGVA